MSLADEIARNNAEVRARRRCAACTELLHLALCGLPFFTFSVLMGATLYQRWF